jgi:hypothetical protein
MARRNPRRAKTAASALASLILHGVVLTAMVAGLRITTPPPEPPAIQVQLVTPFVQPRPIPAAARAARQPVLPPRAAPPVPTPIPQLPLPQTATAPAPPEPTPGPGGPKGLLPSLTGKLGCDDPASFHLNPQQLAECQERLAQTAKTAMPLALDIAEARLAEYDRNRKCRDLARNGGAMPSSRSHDDSTGAVAGLGYNPSFRQCGIKDR